ncbi:MAG: ATP-dependent helicase, partial [Betaproteobacteria bacterium]|nr:ATP-dependent helicase [Betaproteobacteria bacterium]
MFNIVEAVEALTAVPSTDHAGRLSALAALRAILPQVSGDGVFMEAALAEMRLSHATAFSLRVEARPNDLAIAPVLFGRRMQERAAAGQSMDEAEALLVAEQDIAFQQGFGADVDARSTYVLAAGTYVFIDPTLRPALTLVRRAQQGSAADRRALVRSPQAMLKTALLGDVTADDIATSEAEAAIDRLFVETRQFSERVMGFGLWQPPILPKMARPANEWRPESFAFYVQGKTVQVEIKALDEAIDTLRKAISEGAPSVTIGGAQITPDRDFLESLEAQRGAEPTSSGSDKEKDAGERLGGPYALLTRENFLALDYVQNLRRREPDLPSTVFGLRTSTTLLPHQREGVDWLRRAFHQGWPGVLLADDMGVGKTLQALAFLRLLREAGIARRGAPILIVAPVGLLQNWRKEHDTHLDDLGLGERMIRAWGSNLKNSLRRLKGSDTTLGVPALNSEELADADWVLTTYETLRDYQASFGPIKFSVIVLDEIQKAKNPASRLTAAVKTINAGFRIGMTGTPVENGVADLWTVMDCLSPGYLGDLRSFLHAHQTDDAEAQRALAARLLEPTDGKPPPVLRRLKTDTLKGLPKKLPAVEHVRTMPPQQAARYTEVANDLAAKRIPILSALHGFRSASLHPWHPMQSAEIGQDAYVAASARLLDLFAILDDIAGRREKALIFLESLEMQPVLGELLRRRYKLPRSPLIISGAVSGPARHKSVDQFQSEAGTFDVMILSPRAGGVGITLTAANHVIHLSRWWNPAVEDQCTDRVYRIGQERDVRVHLPMAEHPGFGQRSYDLVLNTLLDEKRSVARGLFVATEISSTELSRRMDAGSTGEEPAFDPVELDRLEPLGFEAWVAHQAR